MPSSKTFLSPEQREQIVTAIQEAEGKSSGEIKVYFEKHCKKELLDRAVEIFYQLKMEKTELRTGILIYVAHVDRVFAIIGDKGIHEKVPANFWDETKALMESYFREEKYTEGLMKGIFLAGEQLRTFFKLMSNDSNEISDDIIVNDE
ncbi:MAG TPA: TPM domain-containing protein [Chitinophagales bacterium]|nr:TPM domain-containing protein [Chitinophagales bacterium]